jgi:hypothetical protein
LPNQANWAGEFHEKAITKKSVAKKNEIVKKSIPTKKVKLGLVLTCVCAIAVLEKLSK